MTTVIVAAHGNDPGSIATMRDMAVKTKGRFYQVTNPKALPRIYQKEARIISRPLIFEQAKPWLPNVKYTSEPITGLSGGVPAITGLVQTSPKESELVEVPILSPLPAEQPPPLARPLDLRPGPVRRLHVRRRAGSGRPPGRAWENYAAFWSQVVRWSMRPVDNRNLTLNVRRESRARSRSSSTPSIRRASSSTSSRSRASSSAPTSGPRTRSPSVELVQTAPGRYEGMVENAEASGNYFVTLGYNGADNIKGNVSLDRRSRSPIPTSTAS